MHLDYQFSRWIEGLGPRQDNEHPSNLDNFDPSVRTLPRLEHAFRSLQNKMHLLIPTSSRVLRRISQNLKLGQQTTNRSVRSYSSYTLCKRCAQEMVRGSSKQNAAPRRIRHASTSARGQQVEEPLKAAGSPPKTHYDFFPQTLPSGPPPTGQFVIDPRQLRKEFLQLQAVAHPDRHPPESKFRAEGTSARINEAYKVLQNPLLRAQYLLSLRGVDVAEDETAKVEEPELLMEVLETREEIEAAQEEGELEELRKLNDARITASEKVLDEAFCKDDIGIAKGEAVRLRYWINIKDSLDNWESGKPVVLQH
ncbi:MAG: hypothetical protein M1818_000757 [Claussenomyces sp. TS43310]|nr:MAG: hypothetical protein M1818_000757 [Claussenomyces sp. TS43310]